MTNNSVIVIPSVQLPSKPAQGSECNGCGYCCAEEICAAGEIVFPEADAPCPGLHYSAEHSRTFCKLVLLEQSSGLPLHLSNTLGIGQGCDAVID